MSLRYMIAKHMRHQVKVFHGAQFFSHLLPRYQVLAIEACVRAHVNSR